MNWNLQYILLFYSSTVILEIVNIRVTDFIVSEQPLLSENIKWYETRIKYASSYFRFYLSESTIGYRSNRYLKTNRSNMWGKILPLLTRVFLPNLDDNSTANYIALEKSLVV